MSSNMNIEAIMEKAGAVLEAGLPVCFHRGKVLYGATDPDAIPKPRKLTLTNLTAYYTQNISDVKVREAYVDPATLLTYLERLAEEDRNLNRQAALQNGTLFQTSMSFVEYHLELNNYYWDDRGIVMTEEFGIHHSIDMDTLISSLKLKMSDYNHLQERDNRLSKDDVAHCIKILEAKSHAKKIQRVREDIAFDGTMSEEVLFRTVGELLSIYFIEPSKENILAFCQLMWQVKRKIWQKSMTEELIFSFYSKTQHLGKTYLIQSLAKPFKWGYNGKVKVADLLNADRMKSQVRGNYLIDIQEMAVGGYDKVGTLDIANTMKTMVGDGSGIMSGRVLTTSINGKEIQSAVFTSSTNTHIADIVCDPTGMRRYWEFELNPPAVFNKTFYLKANPYLNNIEDLYRSIDENNEYGYYNPVHPKFSKEYINMFAIQNELGKKDPVTTWMLAKDIDIDDEPQPGFEKISVKNFVRRFNRYMAKVENVEQPFKAFFVTNILHNIHNVEPFRDVENDKEGRYLYIKEPQDA